MGANGQERTRVLVIDDEPPIRLLCRVNLEAEGMIVLEAADGPTGLETARSSAPDVILLDVMMPGLDGWRVAEELLDDEAPIRLLCRVNLEAEGMDVLEAADGSTGLDLARDEQPDVVLLDVMMPGLDGWRVAEEMLEDNRTRGIPIIFLTARAEFRDRARGLDIGGVDYVTKPFNPLDLAQLVRGLLDRIDRGERDELRGEKLAELRALMEAE